MFGQVSEVMMWKTVFPGCHDRWEPLELRMLKQKLANLDFNCKCSQNTNFTSITKDSTIHTLYQYDQNVQTVEDKDTITNIPQDKVTTCDSSTSVNVVPAGLSIFNKNGFCPGCYFTLNMLSGNQTRILKDEEIETNPKIFSCDKSTSKTVLSLEASTSQTFKPVLKSSHITYVDEEKTQNKCNREVTFALEYGVQTPDECLQVNSNEFPVNSTPDACAYCTCAKIIESIRPRSRCLHSLDCKNYLSEFSNS